VCRYKKIVFSVIHPGERSYDRESREFADAWLKNIGGQLAGVEDQVRDAVLNKLMKVNPQDAGACDAIFGTFYSHPYLKPCVSYGLSSRAARFGHEVLIPRVLKLEQELSCRFHKGALFYDTGLAHLLAGDEDSYEYFLALADEEEFRKTPGSHNRGTLNLRSESLARGTIEARMQFVCDFLNGKITNNTANLVATIGGSPIDAPRFDTWRKTLDPQHQFELLRIIHDMHVFLGDIYPTYKAVDDNPFMMLRLVKALAHLAQLVESCLTSWQGATGNTLARKLIDDADFGLMLRGAAGSQQQFAGSCPHGQDIYNELRQLLTSYAAEPTGVQRDWRLLRILYIVRNSTAHTIDPNLQMYTDRSHLLKLLQAVFIAVFSISKLKNMPLP
jgi:hypothetical protein